MKVLYEFGDGKEWNYTKSGDIGEVRWIHNDDQMGAQYSWCD